MSADALAAELTIDRRVLVVDDESGIRDMIALFLRRQGFEVQTAADGSSALEFLRAGDYFLVITDVNMPGLSGLELLSEVKELDAAGSTNGGNESADTDVIIVTGRSRENVAVEALRRGAYDYFRKPFSFDEMSFTLKRLLERRRLRREALEAQRLTVRLESEREHAQQSVRALVEAVYAKDPYTRGHMDRVGRLAARIGVEMGLPADEVEILRRAGTLHDIGKIGTPDAVLNKPGKLDATEWEVIRMHPDVGADILQPIRALAPVCTPVRCHHERFDGSGYPHKLGGTDIPHLARILCVADVCDALHSDRAYRAGLPEATVREIIRSGDGRLYDPEIVAVFEDLCEARQVFEPLVSAESDRRVADSELEHPC